MNDEPSTDPVVIAHMRVMALVYGTPEVDRAMAELATEIGKLRRELEEWKRRSRRDTGHIKFLEGALDEASLLNPRTSLPTGE